jgi:hypothetical protein
MTFMPISTIRKGTIVTRHDQPAQQGLVAEVVLDAIVFVYWQGRVPSFEHINDLCPVGTKKPRPKPGRVGQGEINRR